MIVLIEKSTKELKFWLENLQLIKGKTFRNSQPQITISTDPSLKGCVGGRGVLMAKVKKPGELRHFRRRKII